jgi:hypothetical protein
MRNAILATVICLAANVGEQAAQAQPNAPLPYTQPTVSPYLNLNRRGASSAVNYFGLVRPQLEFRNALRDLQQHPGNAPVNALQFNDSAGLPTTGHAAVFLNTGGYFLNNFANPLQQSRGPAGPAQRTGQTGGVPPAQTHGIPTPRRGF